MQHGAATGEAGPWLRVATERERHRHESEALIARSALLRALQAEHLGAWPQRSKAGLAIWLDAGEREARHAAANAAIEPRTLLVDGAPLAVVRVAGGGLWSAAARHGDRLLVVTAREVDPDGVRLTSAINPIAALGDTD